MKNRPSIYPVIMAGGSGTRFWPLSRHLFPKQLLRIIGEETLIQQTMRRVVHGSPAERVMISTNPGQADSIRIQLGDHPVAAAGGRLQHPDRREVEGAGRGSGDDDPVGSGGGGVPSETHNRVSR